MDGINILTKVPSIDGAFYMVRKEVYMRLINWLNLYEFNEDEESVLKDIDKRYLVEITHGGIFVNLREGSNLNNDPNLLERLLIEYYEYKHRKNDYQDRINYQDIESKLAREERIKRRTTENVPLNTKSDSAEKSDQSFKIYRLKNLNDEGELIGSGKDYESVHHIYREHVKWCFMGQIGRTIYFDHRDYPDDIQYLGVEIIKGASIGSKRYFKIVKEEI